MEEKYIVFIRVDDAGRVIEINSSEFISDITGWIQIDEGTGDRFHHAQNNYLEHPLVDERGIYRYKYIDQTVQERTEAEIAADGAELDAKEQAAKEAAQAPFLAISMHDDILAELTYEVTLMQLGMEV